MERIRDRVLNSLFEHPEPFMDEALSQKLKEIPNILHEFEFVILLSGDSDRI